MRNELIRSGIVAPPLPPCPASPEPGKPRRAAQQPLVVEATLASDVPEYSRRKPLDMDPCALSSDDVSEDALAARLQEMSLSDSSVTQDPRCNRPGALKLGLGADAWNEHTFDALEVMRIPCVHARCSACTRHVLTV
jgi:hypothetical protein